MTDIQTIIGDYPEAKLPKVLGWRIMVKLDEIEDTHPGGLIKADQTKLAEKYQCASGWLIGIGSGYNCTKKTGTTKNIFKTLQAKPGDRIIWGKWSGQFINLTDRETKAELELKLLNDDEILCIIPQGVDVETHTKEMLNNV